MQHGEPGTESLGFCLALRRQWNVGDSGVAARGAPLGLAVAREVDLERQAGLPIISGRPERRERLALSITAPARARCPGRTHTSPAAGCDPCGFSASLSAGKNRVGAWGVPPTSGGGGVGTGWGGGGAGEP